MGRNSNPWRACEVWRSHNSPSNPSAISGSDCYDFVARKFSESLDSIGGIGIKARGTQQSRGDSVPSCSLFETKTDTEPSGSHRSSLFSKSCRAVEAKYKAALANDWSECLRSVPEISCPYCFHALPVEEVVDEKKWSLHVMNDLDPYVCMFQECDSPEESGSEESSLAISLPETRSTIRDKVDKNIDWHSDVNETERETFVSEPSENTDSDNSISYGRLNHQVQFEEGLRELGSIPGERGSSPASSVRWGNRDAVKKRDHIRMDPDRAICHAPAITACDCEARHLEAAVMQAQDRAVGSAYAQRQD
ncbi:hypothetical protein F5B22DRAFT_656231 [Xylaria bambusicola]|uniref:uncharacterized protein n=1 Tax=Xylaria bambusicola TaxID=326684 RepID=UPI0020083756|nr:uncharacterized protein F5B22DRAFT_656231 [Xylaria bambusicola]KAI0515047.1 hypothetical protein F5B22DRAFT_656231 [Xylaria bambusicola]